MKYRKSEDGTKFFKVTIDGPILDSILIVEFPKQTVGTCCVRMSRNDGYEILYRNPICTRQEFEQAYTSAMKIIEI